MFPFRNSAKTKVQPQRQLTCFGLRYLGPALLGSATLLGALNGGKASALDFNFSFTGAGFPTSPASVTGIIKGLLDNTNDQKSGLEITITSATNTPPSGWPVFTKYFDGAGFDVLGGSITGVNIIYADESFSSVVVLGDGIVSFPQVIKLTGDYDNYDSSVGNNSLVFTPIAPPSSVPGPLPLLGAAAAFRVSRQLRRRIKPSA